MNYIICPGFIFDDEMKNLIICRKENAKIEATLAENKIKFNMSDNEIKLSMIWFLKAISNILITTNNLKVMYLNRELKSVYCRNSYVFNLISDKKYGGEFLIETCSVDEFFGNSDVSVTLKMILAATIHFELVKNQ